MDSLAQFGMPEPSPLCWQCESYVAIGDGDTGVCLKEYENWLEGLAEDSGKVRASEILFWIAKNCIKENYEACSHYVEY